MVIYGSTKGKHWPAKKRDISHNKIFEVKTLSGLLLICSSCKKIRNEKDCWNQIENYISKHSEAGFTHSLCSDCEERLYRDQKSNKGKTEKIEEPNDS